MKSFRNISLEDLDRLGIDENRNLYWDGQPLVTKNQIALSSWINFAAVLTAVAAAVTAIVEVLQFLGVTL